MSLPESSLAWLETMLEKHFGPKAGRFLTILLLVLGTLALVLFFAKTIIENGGKQLYEAAKSVVSSTSLPSLPALPNSDALVAALIVTITFLILFGLVFVAILYFLGKKLFRKNVSQAALDTLAELRNEGIDTVWAVFVKNADQLAQWKLAKTQWESKIRGHIEKNFPRSDYLYASHLGVVQQPRIDLVYNEEHLREMWFVIRQMEIVEQILNSYRK